MVFQLYSPALNCPNHLNSVTLISQQAMDLMQSNNDLAFFRHFVMMMMTMMKTMTMMMMESLSLMITNYLNLCVNGHLLLLLLVKDDWLNIVEHLMDLEDYCCFLLAVKKFVQKNISVGLIVFGIGVY